MTHAIFIGSDWIFINATLFDHSTTTNLMEQHGTLAVGSESYEAVLKSAYIEEMAEIIITHY